MHRIKEHKKRTLNMKSINNKKRFLIWQHSRPGLCVQAEDDAHWNSHGAEKDELNWDAFLCSLHVKSAYF